MTKMSLFMEQLAVVRPVYHEGALASDVILATGERRVITRKPGSLVRAALARESVDLRLLHEEAADGGGMLTPPVVHGGHAWMACKLLRPRVPRDPVYGYVRLDWILHVPRRSHRAVLQLVDGSLLETEVASDTLLQALGYAQLRLQRRCAEEARRRRDALAAWPIYGVSGQGQLLHDAAAGLPACVRETLGNGVGCRSCGQPSSGPAGACPVGGWCRRGCGMR